MPVVGMGTWKTFDVARAEQRRDVLDTALASGSNLFDSSPMYGAGPLARRHVAPEKLQPLASFGVTSWSQALLKWLLSDPRVTTVIPATTSPEHARSNALAGQPPWFGPEERSYVARLAEERG